MESDLILQPPLTSAHFVAMMNPLFSGKRYYLLGLLHAALLPLICIYCNSSVRQLSDSEITTWLDLNRGLWEGIIDGKVSKSPELPTQCTIMMIVIRLLGSLLAS